MFIWRPGKSGETINPGGVAMFVPTWVLIVVAIVFAGPILAAAFGLLSLAWTLFALLGALGGWVGVLVGLFMALSGEPAAGLTIAVLCGIWSWVGITYMNSATEA